jgi:hypothetical protein
VDVQPDPKPDAQQLQGSALATGAGPLPAASSQPEGCPCALAAGTAQQAETNPGPPCAAAGVSYAALAPEPAPAQATAGQARLSEQPTGVQAWPPPASIAAQPAANQPEREAVRAAAVPAGALGGSGAASNAAGPPQEAERDCVVCWEQERRVVLVPCGHLVLCR